MIGYFGLFIFQVSTDKVATFKDFNREIGVRTSKYDIPGRKSLTVIEAPELQKIAYVVQLNESLTPNVDDTIEKMVKTCESGRPDYFFLGGKKQGSDQWIITAISEARNIITNKGKTIKAELSIQLEEYISEV